MENILHQKLPFWDKLSPAEQEAIVNTAVNAHFDKGQFINRTDDGCQGAIIIKSGQIRIYIVSDEGREVTLYRLHPGDVCVLSASCLLDSIAFDVIIDAAESTEAVLIPTATLHRVIEGNPYAELFMANTANERFSEVMWTMQQILFMGADKRVAIFLWDEVLKGKTQVLSFTHDEIARYIGSAREVVSRILKYFQEEGVVKLSRGKIEIVDKEKLKSFL